MRSITPPPEHKFYRYLSAYQLITRIFTQIFFFSANVRKKPAVCSKFRESTKAIGNIKSVSPLSPNGLIVFF